MKQKNTADVWKHEEKHLREIKLWTPEIQLEAAELLRVEHTLTFKNIFLFGFLQSNDFELVWGKDGGCRVPATLFFLRRRPILSATQTNPVQ